MARGRRAYDDQSRLPDDMKRKGWQYTHMSKVPNGYCPNHSTGVKLPTRLGGDAGPVRGLRAAPLRREVDRSSRGPASTMPGGGPEMTDPIADIIGDYRAFAAQQRDRLLARGIDIAPYALSHLAYRVPEWDQYVHVRTLLERHAIANRENVWNGRPISLIVPAEPLDVLEGKAVPLIELIPPVHQRVYKMGLEHLGVVVGDTFDTFVGAHKPVLTGQQFQGPNSTPDPVYILFEDFTHVKFYRLSLQASVEVDGGRFEEGFHHVDDWVPQRLVTATGPNPLPR
jgi:predicted metalloenzyme YecM